MQIVGHRKFENWLLKSVKASLPLKRQLEQMNEVTR